MKKCKKLITLILVLTMLASLAAMFTPAASAATGNNRTAAYATTVPTIDGKVDTIWATSEQHALANAPSDYVKLLWREDALYVLGYTKNDTKMTFIISEMWTDVSNKMLWSQTGNECDGNYAVTINSSGTLSRPWYSKTTPVSSENADISVSYSTDSGLYIEARFPLRTVSLLGKYTKNLKVGFMAHGASESNFSGRGAWDKWYINLNEIRYITLVSNSGLPQTAGTTVEMHGAQSNYTEGKTSYDIRLVAEIAGLNGYSEAGFDIGVSYGTEGNMTDAGVQEKVTKKAYTSVLAAGNNVSPTKGDNYLIALEVAGVTISDDIQIVTLTVTPFTKDADGIKSSGATQTYTFVRGE